MHKKNTAAASSSATDEVDMEYVKALKGWLLKKKSAGSAKLLSSDVERWFQVEEMDGPKRELALCYYKTKETSKDARGWIYLRDVTELADDGRLITIVSSARTMELEPKTKMEHKLWLEGLMYLCTNADQRDIMSTWIPSPPPPPPPPPPTPLPPTTSLICCRSDCSSLFLVLLLLQPQS